jgi:hypothetical protein
MEEYESVFVNAVELGEVSHPSPGGIRQAHARSSEKNLE